jgi:hypothetical protein
MNWIGWWGLLTFPAFVRKSSIFAPFNKGLFFSPFEKPRIPPAVERPPPPLGAAILVVARQLLGFRLTPQTTSLFNTPDSSADI